LTLPENAQTGDWNKEARLPVLTAQEQLTNLIWGTKCLFLELW
jgi:hypothetical protein